MDTGVDPVIQVLDRTNQTVIGSNDNWTQATNSSEITALPAAYQLPDRNKNDAAVPLSLPAGVYDVQLSSNAAHGLALIGVDALE